MQTQTQLDVKGKPKAAAALRLATDHHAGIERKFTGEPYINHPIRVAEVLLNVGFWNEELLAAALLHDCLEDKNVRGVTMNELVIKEHCGDRVLRWVQLLSNTEKGNRAQRKAAAAQRIANAPMEVQAVKMADIIDNCTGITDHDPKFAEIYLREKQSMLDGILTTGWTTDNLARATTLRRRAKDVVMDEQNKLAMFHLDRGLSMEAERRADDALIAQIIAEEESSVFAEFAVF